MTASAAERVMISSPADLGPDLIAAVAGGTVRAGLAPGLLAALAENRAAVLAALDGDQPVYGVNTGMGALAGVRLDAGAQTRHQNTLMAGRSVGSAPWLSRARARALLAVRLRDLLHPAAGASPELCSNVAALLDADVIPAIPARGSGAAGEIIPLAHAGAALIGIGQVLDEAGRAADAGPALETAGLRPYSFGAKEGVAFLEGVPGLTGLAVLSARAARTLIDQVTAVVAAEHVVARASRDPWHPAFAAADPELRSVLDTLRGPGGPAVPGALQAPVSFRVSAPALAVALRAAGELEAAIGRALDGVTDSPAFLEGRFVGSAGFAGTDLVAAAGTLTAALVHLAELGVARLHRLLDADVTGLTRQLSDTPGVHAGMVAVHKRAAGVAHRLRRFAGAALIGPVETSAGQEDVQSFGFEAAECLDEVISGLRDVLACEILALHQASLLGASAAAPAAGITGLTGDAGLAEFAGVAGLAGLAGRLPASTRDRPFGRDLDVIIQILETG
ncbi:putative histidine ammonia-lyase [Actinoplanes missouriensis 431]|uniref:Putative histidine ammonia-lyase n=1 Tax=Actinoplanes missouriensis (strain ATCC 14538 / DSM 43046 / CBS 188.64 / JCM 3121 / NBRC 102363 / NCIMB 12654 / NRRL B-3342 / UNCC 431) TaxID=512565 RepID=I0HBI9_ACTM4|nr:aromatic amino acid lyase [Actinoplanes missouriensis]BAL90376.1 putative histidine ammonia-lyase [Actinoplanes missouriensis 431]